MVDFKAIFGTRIGNALTRMEVYSVDDLKKYISEHPFETKRWWEWHRIGQKSYDQIINWLKDQG